jgi:hypothetical protein
VGIAAEPGLLLHPAVFSESRTVHATTRLPWVIVCGLTVQPLPGAPRCPCLVQHLADTINSDADSEHMLVPALSLAGRSAVSNLDVKLATATRRKPCVLYSP